MSATVAKILLGLDAEDMTASIETKEYCRVTLYNGGQFPNGDPYYVTYPVESSDESYYESGDLVRPKDQDTGDELVMDCAWLDSGTPGEKIGLQGKKIAKAVYNRIVGKQYEPFISNNAILNPLAEIGDGVLVNGHYAPIYRRVAYLDQLYTADISAPYKEEEDEEYPYEAKSITEFERIKKSIYGVRTSLTVTDGNINALVERLYDENDGDIVTLSSQVDIQADKISLVVSESQGTNVINAASIVTSINNAGSNVTISADHINLQGQTTFIATQSYADDAADNAVTNLEDEMDAGTTVIDGGCIKANSLSVNSLATLIADVSEDLYVGDGTTYATINMSFPTAGGNPQYGFKIKTIRGYAILESDFNLSLQSQSNDISLATGGGEIILDASDADPYGTIELKHGDMVKIVNPSGSRWEFDATGIYFVNTSGNRSQKVVTQAI